MAESSVRSSQSASRAGHGGHARSPIPYREGPLDYEPAVFCHCPGPLKAPKWISWSDGNPGRRYYRCRHARTDKDCGFYVWIDPEETVFMKTLLRDLRDTVWNLRMERDNTHLRMQAALDDGSSEMKLLNELLKKQLSEKEQELKAKDAAVELLAGQFNAGRLNCSSFFFVLVFGLLFGLLFQLVKLG